jgi:DNA-directed RNA polymerase specialized sigma24 family protein
VPEFEALYRANVAAVIAYFARRSADPQTVADLTADTFVQAITSFTTFDSRKGTPRAWVFGIARRIYAAHAPGYVSLPSAPSGGGVGSAGAATQAG